MFYYTLSRYINIAGDNMQNSIVMGGGGGGSSKCTIYGQDFLDTQYNSPVNP